MKLLNWLNSSSSSKRNNDSTVSATSKKAKAERSWVQKPSFPATEEYGTEIRNFQASDQENIIISLPIECTKSAATKIAARYFSEGNGHSIKAETFSKRLNQPARLKLTKIPTEQSPPELEKRDDEDAVEQPSNVVQVKSSPQLENKNADSSKNEENDLKLTDFSDEKPSPPRKLLASSSSSAGVAGSTNIGGLTLSSGTTLNGAVGAIDEVQFRDQDITELVKIVVGCADWEVQTLKDVYNCARQILGVEIEGEQKTSIKNLVTDLVNQDSEEDDEDQTALQPILCNQKTDPEGYDQLRKIATSMMQNKEYPNVASVLEKHPNLEGKYIRTSLQSTLKYFRSKFQPETNDKAVLKDNESDDNEENSLEEKLVESIHSKGFNIQSNRSGAVPKEIHILALVWVKENGVHKPCQGSEKEALLKQMRKEAEKVGFDLRRLDLDQFIRHRLCWARSVSGLPNSSVGPKRLEYLEKKRKEDQEIIDLYLKMNDRELYDLRESEEDMKKEVDKFINRYIPDLGMTFDEAVNILKLTFYGGITGQVNGGAISEAFRWTLLNSSSANPVLINADGTGIGKTGAERDYGFKVLWVYESICFDNAALFEKIFHLKYMHLPLGRERCWRVAGAGQRSSIVRGQYKVFITYSTQIQAAIDSGKVAIRD